MRSTGRGLGLPLLLFVAFASLPNRAGASPPAGPRWGCWYDAQELVLACILMRKPEGDLAEHQRNIAARIDRRLPPHLKAIWGSPQKFDSTGILIPLWNVPYDMRYAERLADSVMCGLRDDCSVHFDENPDDQARQRAFAIRDGATEAEVMSGVIAPATVLASSAPKSRRRGTSTR